MTVTWTAATDISGVAWVELWRGIDTGAATPYETLAHDAVGYVDAGLVGGHTYRYLLKAGDTFGNVTTTSEASANVTAPASAPAPPPAPAPAAAPGRLT